MLGEALSRNGVFVRVSSTEIICSSLYAIHGKSVIKWDPFTGVKNYVGEGLLASDLYFIFFFECMNLFYSKIVVDYFHVVV